MEKRTSHKKITIKFFLNTKVNHEASDQDNNPLYPLYVQITYNRKNMQLRSRYGMYYRDMDDLAKMSKGLCDLEEKTLTNIIRYEVDKLGDKFELKGLNKRYQAYAHSLSQVFDSQLKNDLRMTNMRSNDFLSDALDYESPRVAFATVLQASRLIFPNHKEFVKDDFQHKINVHDLYYTFYPLPYLDYTFATVIDWLEGGHREAFQQQLVDSFPNDAQKVANYLQTIDEVLLRFLKYELM